MPTWVKIGEQYGQVPAELKVLLEEQMSLFASGEGFMLSVLQRALADVSQEIETNDYSRDKNYGAIVPVEFTIQKLLLQIPDVNPLAVEEHPLVGVYISIDDSARAESDYTLSARAFNAIARVLKQNTMGLIHAPDLELFATLSDKQLLATPGIGPKTLNEIRNLIATIERDLGIETTEE